MSERAVRCIESVMLQDEGARVPFEAKRCIGCGSGQFKVIGGLGLPVDVIVNDKVFQQPEYRTKLCDDCGLIYKSHILNISDLEEYYEEIDYSKWEADALYPTEQAIVDILSKLPEGSKILDYGCSTGRLMSHLTGSNQCYGVEVNKSAASAAEEKGLKILSEDAILNSTERAFDAIVFSDVFEHLLEPTAVLQKFTSRLKRGGLLLLCTGNADAKACRDDVANFWYLRTPEHVCMMTRRHAEYLEQKLPLKLTLWKEMCHYTPGLFEKLKQQTRHFAYRQFKREPPSIWRHALKLVPVIKRARNWELQPLYNLSKDHVIVAYAKTN
jgi:2-polyprenyl-3-methyl-5-hydroxy-6-metoxy-1,4-benzoquinol methylase